MRNSLPLHGSHRPVVVGHGGATLAERLQFTVGEGPCLSDHLEDRVVLATADIMARRWPIFHSELVSKTPYQAIVSLPIDSDEFGAAAAVDLYYTEPRPLISDEEMEEIGLATDIIGALLVANSGLVQTPAAEPLWLNTDAVQARSQVWIAIGMLNVALNLGPGRCPGHAAQLRLQPGHHHR